jgi:hypothetical protein
VASRKAPALLRGTVLEGPLSQDECLHAKLLLACYNSEEEALRNHKQLSQLLAPKKSDSAAYFALVG